MNTIISKTVNRGYLRKMAQQGRLWVKCAYHYTDDYAFDSADNFGKMDSFKQVHLYEEHSHPLEAEIDALYAEGKSHLDVEPLMRQLSAARSQHHMEQQDKAQGKVLLWPRDFGFKSGCAYGSKQAGRLSIHSNLSYEYEVR